MCLRRVRNEGRWAQRPRALVEKGREGGVVSNRSRRISKSFARRLECVQCSSTCRRARGREGASGDGGEDKVRRVGRGGSARGGTRTDRRLALSLRAASLCGDEVP